MKNLEGKKYKRLGINCLIIIVFITQMLLVAGASFSSSFSEGKYPLAYICLLYTSPSPRDRQKSRMPSSA